MTTSPRFGYTELTAGQAVPETTVNEIARYLEQGASSFIFKSKTTAAEPGSPADGDCYLLTGSPTGTHWASKANKIAFYENTAWVFLTPKEGYKAWVNDTDLFVIYDGSSWNQITGTGYLTAANNLSDVASATTSRTNLGLGTVATLASDVDGTLAANSDTRIATQKATKTYVDAQIAATGASITAKDEGVNLTTAMTSINFVGAGVVATNVSNAVTVTVSGGNGSSIGVNLALSAGSYLN